MRPPHPVVREGGFSGSRAYTPNVRQIARCDRVMSEPLPIGSGTGLGIELGAEAPADGPSELRPGARSEPFRGGRAPRQEPQCPRAGPPDPLRRQPWRGRCRGRRFPDRRGGREPGPDRRGTAAGGPCDSRRQRAGQRPQRRPLVLAAGRYRRRHGRQFRLPLLLRHQARRADRRRSAQGDLCPYPVAGSVLLPDDPHGRGAVAPDHRHPDCREPAHDLDLGFPAQHPDPGGRADLHAGGQSPHDRPGVAHHPLRAGAHVPVRPPRARAHHLDPGPVRSGCGPCRRDPGCARDRPGLRARGRGPAGVSAWRSRPRSGRRCAAWARGPP